MLTMRNPSASMNCCRVTAARALRHPGVRPAGRGTQRRLLARRVAHAARTLARASTTSLIRGAQVTGAYCRNCSDATTIGFIDGTWDEKAGLDFTVTFASPDGRVKSVDKQHGRLVEGRLVVTGGAASTRVRKRTDARQGPAQDGFWWRGARTTSRRVLLPNCPRPAPPPAAAAVALRHQPRKKEAWDPSRR